MKRKRLYSFITALVLMFSLFTLAPEDVLTANAAGRYSIRTSYNKETGQLTVEWDREALDTDYLIHFFNDCVDGPPSGLFEEMPDMAAKYINHTQETKYTIPQGYGFGMLHGNGGMNYKVYVERADHSYGEFSDVFRTNIPILDPPRNQMFYENGLITWEDDRSGSFTSVSIYEIGNDNWDNGVITTAKYWQAQDHLQEGKSYYAELRNKVDSGDYNHRASAWVRTYPIVFRKKNSNTGYQTG